MPHPICDTEPLSPAIARNVSVSASSPAKLKTCRVTCLLLNLSPFNEFVNLLFIDRGPGKDCTIVYRRTFVNTFNGNHQD